ncbi:hypothetical protein SSBG_02126 [Streptomyces sp. SPB074]|nr:hypothetical protein SSBG_02126 [Streptomyces sp. SPB074]
MSHTRYPLLAQLRGGRVQHSARTVGNGPRVTTLCRKTGLVAGEGDDFPYCRACRARPNPISQQAGRTSAPAPGLRSREEC